MARKEKKNGENGGNDETDERGYLTPKIIIKMPSSNKRKKISNKGVGIKPSGR